MIHYIIDDHDHYGKTHSFGGEKAEIKRMMVLLVDEGVSFQHDPTTLDWAVISRIPDDSYQALVKAGKIR